MSENLYLVYGYRYCNGQYPYLWNTTLYAAAETSVHSRFPGFITCSYLLLVVNSYFDRKLTEWCIVVIVSSTSHALDSVQINFGTYTLASASTYKPRHLSSEERKQ